MNICHAVPRDLPRIQEIYAIARSFMRSTGNMHQWVNGYPQQEVLLHDIEKGQLYVCRKEDTICGVFMFMLDEEPTYRHIEGGSWPNEKPYGTIHRIASDGSVKGIFTVCHDFVKQRTDEIRIDTHHDNLPMQHVVEKHGFKKCGIIYLENGDPRIAYQWSKEKEHENI